MSLLNTILSAQGGGVVNQLAQQFGLSPEQAQNAVSSLLPAITGKMQDNASNPGGLSGMANAISSGDHQQFLDDPSQLQSPQAAEEGHGILGHLFGNSGQASEQIADQASQETGLHPSLLKSMLPVVASLAMGALSKHAEGTAEQQGEGGGAGGLMGALGSILGSGGQGGNLQGAMGSFLGGQEGETQGGGREARPEARDEEDGGPENAGQEEDSGSGLLDMAKKFFS